MNKAVFIDRDGVINSDKGLYYIYKPEDFVINPGVKEFLKLCSDNHYKIIVITNQGGIAKGDYGHAEVQIVHQKLKNELLEVNVTLDSIYYCPHHDSKEYCFCRKPNPLMIEKAVARFNIDKTRSFFIGDRKSDVETALRAGVKPIKVKTNGDLMKIAHKILDDAV